MLGHQQLNRGYQYFNGYNSGDLSVIQLKNREQILGNHHHQGITLGKKQLKLKHHLKERRKKKRNKKLQRKLRVSSDESKHSSTNS